MAKFDQDEGLQAFGEEIIQAYRPELADLAVAFVFRDEAAKSKGKVVAGKCIRIEDRNFCLHGFEFVIEIARDIWDKATPEFRRALVHHEICHINAETTTAGIETDKKTGRKKAKVIAHDVEEFEEVIEEHGAYHAALMNFLRTFNAAKKEKADKDNFKLFDLRDFQVARQEAV